MRSVKGITATVTAVLALSSGALPAAGAGGTDEPPGRSRTAQGAVEPGPSPERSTASRDAAGESSGWVVVDARGVMLGGLLGQDRVVGRIDDQWVLLPVTSVGFDGSPSVPLYYEGAVCAGDAYVFGAASVPPPVSVVGGTRRGYVPGPPEARTAESMRWVTPEGEATCEPLPSAFTYVFGRATEVDLTTFQPPFRIEPAP